MDGENNGSKKPYEEMDDLGVFPWFLETPIYCYTPGSSNIAGWKMGARIQSMYFLLKMGDIPASYVRIPEGRECFLFFFESVRYLN